MNYAFYIHAFILLYFKTAKFVKDNRGKLIKNVTEVMAILEELGDMVHEEAYSDIKAIATSREKMRELYERTLRSGGDVVRAAFYDALKEHHPQLVERLGRISSC